MTLSKEERLARQREYQRKWRANNPERLKEYGRRSRSKVPLHVRVAANKEWRSKNPEERCAHDRKARRKRTGVIDATAESKQGVCPICNCDSPLVLDHCHDTGLTRGWICSKCNSAIGLLGDSVARVLSAAAYLAARKRDPAQRALF